MMRSKTLKISDYKRIKTVYSHLYCHVFYIVLIGLIFNSIEIMASSSVNHEMMLPSDFPTVDISMSFRHRTVLLITT